jgi:hypothetical protein
MAGRTIQKLPGVDDLDFDSAVNSLKALIVYTIEQSMLFPLDEKRDLWGSIDYAKFASFVFALIQKHGIRFRGVTIITFNYDIGAEVAFVRKNLPYGYIVDQQPGVSNVVKLLKIHGSINWGQVLNSDNIVSIPVELILSNFGIQRIVTDQSVTRLPLPIGANFERVVRNNLNVDVEPTPVIVPPGLFKTEYQGSISRVWQQAAIELESAKEIIVIGYSLPESDFFFRNLYALGTVGKAFIRRFAVFNPDNSGLVNGRFKSLLGPGARDRFEYHAIPFESAIQTMSDWYLSDA